MWWLLICKELLEQEREDIKLSEKSGGALVMKSDCRKLVYSKQAGLGEVQIPVQ